MNRESKYWRERANLRMDEYHKNSDSTISLIIKAYDKAIKQINDDIYKIFYKFMKDGRLDESEARDLLNSNISKKDLEDIRNRINQIQDDDIKSNMMAELNSKAYKARITRLEALKESIYINCMKIADAEIHQSTRLYINNINQSYYRNIYDIQKGTGMAFDFATMPVDTIEEILKNNWSGKHFSKRVWRNTTVLSEELTKTITFGLMAGTSSRKMAIEIQDLSEYGKFAAERLIRTETTYVTNMAEKQSYKECGIEKYVFIATLDLRTSKTCRQHDKKVYLVSKAVPGKNMPPLHPWCRSTTIAYRDEETLNNLKRRARDPKTGKTYVLANNMSYSEWYQKYVVERYGPQNAEKFEKMINNKSYDRNQYRKYVDELGKEAPKTFDKFQELKYNNSNEWNDLKQKYADINRFNKIVNESANLNIKGNVIKKIDRIDINEYKFAETHINSERGHNVTKEMAQSYIDNAKVVYSRWNGQVNIYLSEQGCSVVNLKDKIISTAYKCNEYDHKFSRILEVIKDDKM